MNSRASQEDDNEKRGEKVLYQNIYRISFHGRHLNTRLLHTLTAIALGFIVQF